MSARKTVILKLNREVRQRLMTAVACREPVTGLTHNFYRYPARFSPQFARTVIETFTSPGDVILDPFMGGATSLVEARALGRTAIGLDVNELACFIASVKTSALSDHDFRAVTTWMRRSIRCINLHRPIERPMDWIAAGYQRNINTRQTWTIRKALELALDGVSSLKTQSQQNFARALVLRTGQWALDCRSDVPSAAQFRRKMAEFFKEMTEAASNYRALIDQSPQISERADVLILNRSAEGIDDEPALLKYGTPKLVLTSPPYPGVHVLYHRWQILGRKETPAAFWISGTLDGDGTSYYTFGDRKQPTLEKYFDTAKSCFRSIAKLAARDTLFVQMVAFPNPSWQLPTYLKMMRAAGLEEIKLRAASGPNDGRLWRIVPNRKWYADQRGPAGAAKEVVLFHQLRR